MSDPQSPFGGQPGPGQQPSEEELRAYLMELRQADPAEFLMQAVNLLVTGAQAKIGMADGRFLIDALAGAVSAVQDRLPPQLSEALENAVVQLQTAQVQAERELAAMQGEPIPPGPGGEAAQGQEGGGVDGGGAPQDGGPTISEPQKRMTDRLWVPGKGTPPVR